MNSTEIRRAVAAAKSIAVDQGLAIDDAIILANSNRLVLRLIPCDVVVRIAPMAYQASAEFEVAIAGQLAEANSPIAALEPRVEPRAYVRGGFVINMWTYCEPVAPDPAPADYADALARLHARMREIDLPSPHFTDRVAEAQRLVADRALTPELGDVDRELLSNTLHSLTKAIGDRGAAEQLLHGEPHPGNVLSTSAGPLFIDLETCCRGPIEFDLAHVPEEVVEHYPGADHDLLRECRILMLAMVTTWRWDRNDQLPDGRQRGNEWLSQMRAELDAYRLDAAP
jgi:aminoglycoside phosphotransferase (APT) family kinase protein